MDVEEKSEILSIEKIGGNKVVVKTRSGTNTLESTIYIFPQDIFTSKSSRELFRRL